jgi:phosphopantetheine--protein transferase-like protein
MKQSGVVLQEDGARATPVLGFDVHIWRIALDAPISQMDLTALSPAELTRGRRFVFERDQRRYLAAHAALRTVLSVYIGQAPEGLDLRQTSEGKPVLADRSLAFNLSHSGELALVAVAAAGQVGVDIELIAPLSDEMSIARSLFAPGGVMQLDSLTSDARRLMFYRFWTCREALLKAAGVGLSGVGLEIGMEANGARDRVIIGMIAQQAGMIGFCGLVLAIAISFTIYPRFPRTVLITESDLGVLSLVLMALSLAASWFAIRRALAVRAQEVLA